MRLFWWVLAATPGWAHVVSMSSGELVIDGTHARYELRMPLYEVTEIPHPETALLEHIRFTGAKLVESRCHADGSKDAYICSAQYEFASASDRVEVECTLASITVPNHVHMLRAAMNGRRDQAVLDRSFPQATLRFRPPTAIETAITEAGGGLLRAVGGPVQLLFLAALAMAARSRRELVRLVGMFLVGQVAAVLIVPRTGWDPAPRFVEAAAALAIAYLAVEVLVLPKAGARSLVAGVIGVFYGLLLYLFVATADYRPGLVLAGAALAEIAVTSLLAVVLARVLKWGQSLRAMQVAASAVLVFAMAWFVLRLRG